MKTFFKISVFILSIFLIHSCKKEKDLPPVALTQDATDITNLTATIKGNVNASNLLTEVSFEFGSTTVYGQSITAVPSQISGEVETSIIANVTGLKSGEKYHYRVKATNSAGTVFGDDREFSTSVVDYEGNIYTPITIGTQTWLVENLKSAKLNDGTIIQNVTINTQWSGLQIPGYCWYNNNETANKDIYGALYNWFAVGTGKLCPAGWHVPSVSEWLTLSNYLGGADIAAVKLKETGTSHWDAPSGSTNESGFTARGGGMRTIYGVFSEILHSGYWWTNETSPGGTGAFHRTIISISPRVSEGNYNKTTGLSVRCIRD